MAFSELMQNYANIDQKRMQKLGFYILFKDTCGGTETLIFCQAVNP
jgi:hypothetical protein